MMKSYGIETPYERSRRLALEKIERRKANVERQKELRARHLLALRRQRMHSSRRKRPALDCSSVRVFFPKGCLAKSYIVENDLTGIPVDSCERVVAICERILKEKYSELESMGKVWISERLRDYIVPFSRRSASKSLRTITRGSRLRFSDDVQVVRGFIWWKNAKTNWRTDLDLSALLLDEHWQYVEHVSFTNLRSTKTGSCHSGDIVNAPAGAAEYIDIDLQKAQKAGARYVVFSVHGFTVQNFCDLPECSFGWMEREPPQAVRSSTPRQSATRSICRWRAAAECRSSSTCRKSAQSGWIWQRNHRCDTGTAWNPMRAISSRSAADWSRCTSPTCTLWRCCTLRRAEYRWKTKRMPMSSSTSRMA